ncbi:DUF11 domain-containing protein [Nitrososphaera viennensis]|uniref:DUF11 domain-containing protein n=2 Tax=Nitrososphaera viennensis TaxID=1034015 RepID=A0A060HFX5_9ARCH|nr:DUF11 domain-containing protein [Nitrososphaera viennensis]AIC14275.1 hypothetical protein NVIE_000940 [Nitrososphaera viennensis EN76]UVS69271.1 DUF11 domain-containing protein [Nitrososphaera viennensis]
MKLNKPIAFVVLAFIIGATISQGSFAFADDSSTNPFRAIWEAIGELQTKTDSLQSQINDLKMQQQGASASSPSQIVVAKASETSLSIDLSSGQSGQTTLISLVARNAGPDSAVGVKLSTYYQMSLFRVNFIDGAQCTDQARGIIECYLGTIESGGEARITIDATPLQPDQQAIITADASSITEDANPGNNHAEIVFVTSQAPVEIPPSQQPQQPAASPVEQPSEQSPEAPPAEQQQPRTESNGEQQQASGEQASQPGSEQPNSEDGAGGSGDSSSSPSDNNPAASSESSSSDSNNTSPSDSSDSTSPDDSNSSDSSSSGTNSGDAGSSSSGDSAAGGGSASSDSSASDSGAASPSDSSSANSGESGSSGASGSGSGSNDTGSSSGDSGATG